MNPGDRGFVLVVSLQPLDASTTLFFGHLMRLMPDSIRVAQYGKDDIAGALASAAAVVFVRGLFEFGNIARCAKALGVPLYYFVDDNFIVLREQGGIGAEFVMRYSAPEVRAALHDFEGVLLATPALMSYFLERGLHSRLFLFPPVADAQRLAAPRRDPAATTLAFFGGRHLHRQLLDTIVPAVRRLARQRPVRLLAVGVTESIPASEGLSIRQQPYDESYGRGLRSLAAEGVDVFVHPVAAGVVNNAYKNPHALISAHALGAVPVVSNAPPYDSLGSDGVALLSTDDEESWYRALNQAVTDDSLRSTLSERLSAYCAEHFSGSANRTVVDTMLRAHTPRGRTQTLWRTGIARGYLALNLAGRLVSRIGRATGVRTVAVTA